MDAHAIARPVSRQKLFMLAAYSIALLVLLLRIEAMRTEAGSALLVIVTVVVISAADVVPVWGITALLWIATPLVLWQYGSEYAVWNVVLGSFHPVLIVFFTGYAFAAAAHRHGIDERLTMAAIRIAKGDHFKLIILIAVATVWLSAWISNIAAAALMFGAVRPLLRRHLISHSQQRSVILTIAVAANLGGMATPIGTGANAIAIAAVAPVTDVTFAKWMIFAIPLTAGLVAAMVFVANLHVRPVRLHPLTSHVSVPVKQLHRPTAVVFCATVVLWVLEPLHGVAAYQIAIAAAVLLIATRAITWTDVKRLDWGTLILIAGGIGIGTVMSESGAAHAIVNALPITGQRPTLSLFFFCLLSATLAGVMSNTGTAALLIPVAMTLLPNPSTAILIALATTLGFPFSISTPPNAMAVQYGVRPGDFVRVSLPAMIGGCLLLALTGRYALGLLGVP